MHDGMATPARHGTFTHDGTPTGRFSLRAIGARRQAVAAEGVLLAYVCRITRITHAYENGREGKPACVGFENIRGPFTRGEIFKV